MVEKKLEPYQKALGETAIDYLSENNLLTTPDLWKPKLAESSQNWMVFEMLKRIHVDIQKMIENKKSNEQDIGEYIGVFTATAYDLSIDSCGKPIDHPLYGITASGYSLKDLTREQAMSIATDKKYPFGTRLRLVFDGSYEQFSGIYTVRDRGGAINGNALDIFFGDFKSQTAAKETLAFGRRGCKVYLIK